MIAKGRVKRVEAAHRSRHRGTGGGFVVGIEDREAGTVTVGDQVMTLAQWEALEGHKILVIEREEEVTV
jgi:hypothetical protein